MSDGTILIVDDEQMIRDLLIAMLEESGNYRLITAVNGKEALDICNSEDDIDLVITDLRMPVMNGMELLAELRRTHPNLPIVILTGYGRREDVIEALRLGASNFLLKPQEVEMVHAVTSKILRMRHREKVEQRIIDFLLEDRQHFEIPSDLQFTLPLIDMMTDKIAKIGICSEAEVTNIRLALDEALVNALVHGNLDISSRVKGSSLDEMLRFNKIVKERSQQEPYCHRKVKITRIMTQDSVTFEIHDEGQGFDWRSLPEGFEDVKVLANYGRGIFLIRAFMNDVTFNEKGNCITLTKRREPPSEEKTVIGK